MTMTTTLDDITKKLQPLLKAYCDEKVFAAYIVCLQFATSGAQLHVFSPNRFTADWVKQHCHETLQEVLSKLMPQADIDIEYQVGRLSDHQARPEDVLHSKLINAGVPARYLTARFKHLHQEYPQQIRNGKTVQAYARQFQTHLSQGNNLIFCGSVGTGKSYLACALLAALASHSIQCHYTRVSDLMRQFGIAYSPGNLLTEQAVMARYCQYDLLVIDELGLQRQTEATLFILSDILCGRYDIVKPSVLISNWPPKGNAQTKGLLDMLGSRVFDRITSHQSQLLNFDWPSYRKPQVSKKILPDSSSK
jgi:DNA replication protein DnaC